MKVSAIESALLGIRKANEQAAETAERIANTDPGKDEGNLIQDIVDLKMAKHNQDANLIALKTADEMLKKVIDILA